ncbi:MAG TPA: SGNH/GDSL hydrolase family protein [Gemmatimonadaceae bacterium]|nr:SGNH/GDSL hydrolase family protein [Gemmatimonadaceae bacterium]
MLRISMSSRHTFLRPAAHLVVALTLLSCSTATTAPQNVRIDGQGRRVLFIGNSYLYTRDIPGIVQALADSADGDKLAVATVAGPDMALVDHWNEGTARRAIALAGWEWVVLQQGPSSVEINRDSLRLMSRLFASEIVKVNARPALFSAWPTQARRQDFDRAIESYNLAAADVNGLFLPIASAWLAEWQHQPEATLYADGLHPSAEGAYLSALVIYSRLLGKTPRGLPAILTLHSGFVLTIDPVLATELQASAAEVTGFP